MRTPWTIYQIEKLEEMYPNTPADQLTDIVGHCVHSIYSKAFRLGIKANLLNRRVKHWNFKDKSLIDNLPETEKAYIAGIIDGEGTLRLYRLSGNRLGVTSCLAIINTHKPLLEWIMSKIPESKLVPRKLYKSNRKACFELRLYGIVKVKYLLLVLLPYLIVKREDAKKVLNYQSKYVPRTLFDDR